MPLKFRKMSGLAGNPLLHIVIVAAVGFFAYSNTFNDPFQWDDTYFIAENPVVKDLSYFRSPSIANDVGGGGTVYRDALKSRYIGYLSFALNYRLHGLDVTGYHVVNFVLHLLNALLVYVLAGLIFKTPFLEGSGLRQHAAYIAFFSSLFFVSHPVQTEAVTYIFQRLASLSALFYLMSVILYIRSRSLSGLPWYLLYALSLASAVLAMKTKETAFTLPVVLVLFELLFMKGPEKLMHRLLPLVPFILMVFIIPISLAGMDMPLEDLAKGYPGIPRKEYLLTELRVVSTYIRLLFLPVGQNVDYDYPLYNSLYDPEVFLSFVFFICVLGVAFYFYRKSRLRTPESRVIAFGIFWFFITLSVESSVIPLMRVIDEYRLYLPSAGFFIGIVSGAFILVEKVGGRRMQRLIIGAVMVFALGLSYLTRQRNELWQSREDLWRDAVEKSPNKAVPHMNLGVAYYSGGLVNSAIEHYERALALRPDFAEAHYNMGVALAGKGDTAGAMEHYRAAVGLRPDYAKAHHNLGLLYGGMGLIDNAVEHYRAAIDLMPGDMSARNNLGAAYAAKGMTKEALGQFAIAAASKVGSKDDYSIAHYNIGLIYMSQGLLDRAIEHLEASLKYQPDNVKAHNNLGVAFASKGLTDRAIEHFRTVARIRPGHADAHYNLALAYKAAGVKAEAVMHFNEALRLAPSHLGAHFNLAIVYYGDGRIGEARGELEAVLRLNPRDADALRLLKALRKKGS